MSKLISKASLKDHVFDGMSIMVGGFMTIGSPFTIIDELVKLNVQDLTIICNDAGLVEQGVGALISNGQVKKLIASHIGLNPIAGKLMSEEKMICELIPQGTLVEQIRCGGAGIGGFLTKTGLDTIVEEGKQIIVVKNERYILEEALKADLAILYGSSVDHYGNVVYTKTIRNFNPIMATAAKKVIVEARNIVDYIDPDVVHTPHIFIDYIIKEGTNG